MADIRAGDKTVRVEPEDGGVELTILTWADHPTRGETAVRRERVQLSTGEAAAVALALQEAASTVPPLG